MRSADDSVSVAPPGIRTTAAAEADDTGTETYDVDAEFSFSQSDLILTPTLLACPALSFRYDVQSWSGTDAEELFVTVSGAEFGDLDDALADDPTVAAVQLVAAFETERLYRVTASPTATQLMPLFTGIDAVVREIRGTNDSWSVRAHVASRSVLSALTDRCRGVDVSMTVVRLARLGSVDEADSVVLSGQQRELLQTAIEKGYFETPRGISQNDLANMFGVSPSAISQRLRTATGKLVAHKLGSV